MEPNLGALLIVMAANGTFSYHKFPDVEQCRVAEQFTVGLSLDASLARQLPGSAKTKCIDLATKKEVK